MSRHAHITNRCPRCRLQLKHCLCASLPDVICPVPVIVIQHWKESLKPTSTGSLLATVLSEGSTRLHGHRNVPFDPSELDRPDTWLVFPTRSAPPVIPTTPPRQLVLLDGNWNQASRMARRIPQVAMLPRLSLTAPARAVRRLRLPRLDAAVGPALGVSFGVGLVGLMQLHERFADEVFELLVVGVILVCWRPPLPASGSVPQGPHRAEPPD